MAYTVAVLGVGPGNIDYITAVAAKRLAEADIVVGSKRLLETFVHAGQQTHLLTADLKHTVQFIKDKCRNYRVAVLVSGDTGLYSFADYLVNKLTEVQIEIIPGISSVQLMFAKLKRPWQHATVVSLHGRTNNELLYLVSKGQTVAVLTDNDNTPQVIARYLLDGGCQNVKVAVGANLSYSNEYIFHGDLNQLRMCSRQLQNSVMVINYE